MDRWQCAGLQTPRRMNNQKKLSLFPDSAIALSAGMGRCRYGCYPTMRNRGAVVFLLRKAINSH